MDQYVVAVRELCEFAAKEGDLDLRFTPAPTALEGTAGHAVVAKRRGPARQKEVRLSATVGQLVVRGRADGYDAECGVLDEVKTFKGDVTRIPANQRALHWAQAKVYAAMLCAQFRLPSLRVSLVYFEIGTQKEIVLEEAWRAENLASFLTALCDRFWRWARHELEHRARRNACLCSLRFPLSGFRKGQRALAERVFKVAASGRCLAAEASTGIGKTIGTLFPALKAMPGARLDKVFFLTAKSSGHIAPLDTLNHLRHSAPELSLRTLELISRDAACLHPELACHGESCPLARGFYDRLPQARAKAVDQGQLTQAVVRQIALDHRICPYYLGQELARWADVIVADYNYYFDSSALLHAMTMANEWRVAVLVDEAHNLIERARTMYTAQLSRERLRIAIREAPPLLGTQLRRLRRSWHAVVKEQTQPYASFAAVPPKLAATMHEACSQMSDMLADSVEAVSASLLGLYFDLVQFNRLVETFGPHSVFEVQIEDGGRHAHLGIRNVVPAPFLAPRFRLARSAVLFSATLSPQRYYSDTLGLPPETVWLEVEPPFLPYQLKVKIAGHISTRFDRREESLSPIARLIGEQVQRRPGNYLAFFSSFEYLGRVRAAFESAFPDVHVWCQTRDRSEIQRSAFLSQFVAGGSGVGFAVLGGAFAEGVDLSGERVAGAFIATLGLPPTNPINEMMKQTLEAAFGAGYEYAYLLPGLRKVVQAAGRVVRGPTDTGVLYLIDDRYSRARIQRLLPAWWRLET
jgi:DNA excision repair protein ERCC-2